jgi:hypothetical protein
MERTQAHKTDTRKGDNRKKVHTRKQTNLKLKIKKEGSIMTKATANKIELIKEAYAGKWFTAKNVKELLSSDFIRTLVKNAPEIIIDKQTITVEINQKEYMEAIEKYADRMDSVNFGGIGYYFEENGKYYNKRTETRYKFPD